MAVVAPVISEVLKQGCGKGSVFRTRLMAVHALQRPVLAFETELGISVMIKLELSALPSRDRVAGSAFIAKLRHVRVLVAVGAGVVLDSYIEALILSVRPSPVTFVALDLAVFAFELEVRQIVVEFLLVELDDLPHESGVFFVTFSARPLVLPVVPYGAFFSLLDYVMAF